MEKIETISDVRNSIINTQRFSPYSDLFNKTWEAIKSNEIVLGWATSVHVDKNGQEYFNEPGVCDIMFDLQEECVTDEKIRPFYENVVDAILSSESLATAKNKYGEMYLTMALRNHSIELTEQQKKHVLRCAEDYILNGYNKGLDVTDLPEFDVRFEILRNPNWSSQEKYQMLNNFFASPENFDYFLDMWFFELLSNLYDVNGVAVNLDPNYALFYDFEELRNIFCGDNNKPTEQSDEMASRLFQNIRFLREMSILRTAYCNGSPRVRIDVQE